MIERNYLSPNSEPEKEQPIPRAMRLLKEQSCTLHKTLDQLDSKLSPILQPLPATAPTDPVPTAENQETGNLAVRIECVTEDYQKLTHRLCVIIHRLQL